MAVKTNAIKLLSTADLLIFLCTVEAVCENLPAGDHVIKVKIERCESRTTTPRLTTGWESGQRMHIEEIRPVQRLDGG